MRIDGRAHNVVYLRCEYCLAPLSLGPASHDGPHAEQVRVEIRAAEIAQEVSEMTEWWLMFNATPSELSGYQYHQTPTRNGAYTDMNAGYLARCIANHDAEQGAA